VASRSLSTYRLDPPMSNFFTDLVQSGVDLESTRIKAEVEDRGNILSYLLGMDKNAIEKLLGEGRLNLDAAKAEIERQLGNRGLDIQQAKQAAEQLLGEGRLRLDEKIALEGFGLQREVENIRAATQQYGQELDANSRNYASQLGFLGQQGQTDAAKLASQNALQGVLAQVAGGTQNAQIAALAQLLSTEMGIKPAMLAEEGKSNRFGKVFESMDPLFGIFGQALGQQFGVDPGAIAGGGSSPSLPGGWSIRDGKLIPPADLPAQDAKSMLFDKNGMGLSGIDFGSPEGQQAYQTFMGAQPGREDYLQQGLQQEQARMQKTQQQAANQQKFTLGSLGAPPRPAPLGEPPPGAGGMPPPPSMPPRPSPITPAPAPQPAPVQSAPANDPTFSPNPIQGRGGMSQGQAGSVLTGDPVRDAALNRQMQELHKNPIRLLPAYPQAPSLGMMGAARAY
jgi:hypothetical protein